MSTECQEIAFSNDIPFLITMLVLWAHFTWKTMGFLVPGKPILFSAVLLFL